MKARYIPNIISAIRIILVGVFVYVFFAFYPEGVIAATVIFILSGITDVVDGAVARHFGWISSVGKVLDPIADKLMQCTVLLCLSVKGIIHWWLFVFFIIKECMMAVGAVFLFKKRNEVYGSKFFGKAATVLFYTLIAVILVWNSHIGDIVIDILCVVTALAAVIALVLYSFSYLKNKKTGVPYNEGSM